ncbi:MAG: cyclopropane-fatty-acyl-phospholipid synthase family protein, partial [Leptospira sp.]|nr:cyclopropane-fatty-acyl-phospholipid synthase family protein [Leptospira sp.]
MEQVKARSLADILTSDRRMSVYEKIALKLLSSLTKGSLTVTLSDGTMLQIGEKNSTVNATLRINNPDMFRKSILYGDVGFGESYVDGDWDTDSITNFISWWILNYENNPSLSGSKRKFSPMGLLQIFDRISHLFRANTKTGSQKNISEHYDLSNDFYSLWLDTSMTYSSAYFQNGAVTLEEGQFQKYDRICRKLKIDSNDHVLEIGSGWGGFAVHAAKNYGCRVTTVTISKEQFAFAKARFEREGVADRVDITLMDYRNITGTYSKIVSIEMLEAVGHEFLETYFAKCQELLAPNGLAGFQVITSPDSRYDEFR